MTVFLNSIMHTAFILIFSYAVWTSNVEDVRTVYVNKDQLGNLHIKCNRSLKAKLLIEG